MIGDLETIGVIASVSVALASTLIAAGLSIVLARRARRDAKRAFCFELLKHFDNPEMFRFRFQAWQKLKNGDFDDIKTVSELFASPHWCVEVSAVVHFFESLESYCEHDLVDVDLACKIFSRPYAMWYGNIIGKLVLDEASLPYANWHARLKSLNDRLDCLPSGITSPGRSAGGTATPTMAPAPRDHEAAALSSPAGPDPISKS